jgi:hypothetical protein
MVRSSGKPAHHANLTSLTAGWFNHCVPIALAALLYCAPLFSKADDQLVTEYRIKAAFLYNFSRFIGWPDAITQTGRFTICVLGVDPFGDALDTLAGKRIQDSTLDIRRLPAAADMDDCRLAYISESESDRVVDILASVGARPILTVSDTADFAERGGIIRLKLVDKKVRFDINTDAAQRAGLSISSKLLSLATIVRDTKTSKVR